MKQWIVPSIGLFFLAAVVSVPLSFCNLFTHEGAHGVLVVPGIIMNGEVPSFGAEGENPFKNFPPAALLFVFSFPLGVLGDSLICYLCYRNAVKYRSPARLGESVLLVVFLSFCCMTLKSALGNLLTGEDFSFVWKAVGLPFHRNDLLSYLLKAIAFLAFPVYLGLRKGFALPESVATSAGALVGAHLAGICLLPLIAGWLMTHFFWMFIIGLPVFVILTLILWRMWRWKPKDLQEKSKPEIT